MGPAAHRSPGPLSKGRAAETPTALHRRVTSPNRGSACSIAVVWISNTDSPFNGGVQSIGYRVWRPDCELGPDGWSPVQLITVPGAFYHSDPTVAANERGDFFISFLAAFGPHTPPDNSPTGRNDRRVYVARLSRRAMSVEPAVLATRNPFTPLHPDRPTIAVSPRGTLLVAYTEFNDQSMRLLRSEDGGATWTEAVVDGSGFGFEGQVCVPRRGHHRVYVMKIWWGAPGSGPSDARANGRFGEGVGAPTPGLGDPAIPAVHLHWSDDDGVTFRPEDVNRWPMDPILGGGFTCDARDDDVWIAGGLASDFTDAATATLHIAHFVDGGLTLAGESVPEVPANVYFTDPVIVAGLERGLDVMAYRFEIGAPVDGQFVRIHSGDGETWSAPDVLAEHLSRLGDRHGLAWLGDYVGGPHRDRPRHRNELSRARELPRARPALICKGPRRTPAPAG